MANTEELTIDVPEYSVENVNEVPKKQWAKWGLSARHVFNTVYGTMVGNQFLFMHPKASPQVAEHWKTVAWNAAWMAAEAERALAE